MANTGRNDPCPCGSGKKYKKCCLPADQAAAAAAAKARARQQATERPAMPTGPWTPETFFFEEEDLIDDYSNRVLDLIDDGDLDGAEQACRMLEEKFPEFIDCPDRRATLCEARGELEQAIAYNERCLEIIAEDPQDYETAHIYEDAITRLRRAIANRAAATKPGDPKT